MDKNNIYTHLYINLELEFISGIDFVPKPRSSETRPKNSDNEYDSFKSAVLQCTKCKLCEGRTQVVFGVGNIKAKIMFVGEAPGYDEDVKGEPFVGRAGQLLNAILRKLGVKREDIYIANIVKCRPPDNRKPTFDEIVACIPYLFKQIKYINPEAICTLGSVALNALTNSTKPISRMRGKFITFNNMRIFPTWHPAYILRNMGELGTFENDLKFLFKELRSI